MKSLKTLIKLQKRELDQLRRQVAALEGARDNLIATIERLQDELVRELEAANTMMDLRGFFGDFSDAIKKKQRALASKVVQFEQQIQELAIEIGNRFSELKKYEIALEAHKKREKEKEAKKEQAEMDEMGLRIFRYKDSL